jgi:translation elongation factor EF-4
VNKIDLPSADPERALEQMRVNFELDPTNAVLVSAKTGLNVEKVLPAVCENAPAYIYPHIQQLQYNLTLEI